MDGELSVARICVRIELKQRKARVVVGVEYRRTHSFRFRAAQTERL